MPKKKEILFSPFPKFSHFDKVNKKFGYKYPATIVSVFMNLRGEWRYVCECIVPECEGMLHIFNEEQLEFMEVENETN